MSFFNGIFGSKNREIPNETTPLLNNRSHVKDESDEFADLAFQSLQEDTQAPHHVLSGRAHQQPSDRTNDLVQQRLAINSSQSSPRLDVYGDSDDNSALSANSLDEDDEEHNSQGVNDDELSHAEYVASEEGVSSPSKPLPTDTQKSPSLQPMKTGDESVDYFLETGKFSRANSTGSSLSSFSLDFLELFHNSAIDERPTPSDSQAQVASTPLDSKAQATSTSSQALRSDEGNKLDFLRSVNPIVALRLKNVVIRLINWIGDLVAKLRGKSGERFASQVMELTRKNPLMCGLLATLKGEELSSLAKTILKESGHPLSAELKAVKKKLEGLDPQDPNYQKLSQRKDELKLLSKIVVSVFCAAVRKVADTTSVFSSMSETKRELNYQALQNIHTVEEFERFVVEGQRCGEVNLEALLDKDHELHPDQEKWLTASLTSSALPVAEKIKFLSDYGLLNELNAFEVVCSSSSSLDENLQVIANLEKEGIKMSFSLFKALSESMLRDIGSRDGFDSDLCSLEEIDSRLTPDLLEYLQDEDPFVRQLFQAWALAKPDQRMMTPQEINGATVAGLLENRRQKNTNRILATDHTLTRMNTAFCLAQYVRQRESGLFSPNLSKLQLFVAMCPYGRGPDGKLPLFDALGNTGFFKNFDKDLDEQIARISLPQKGQSLDDYVGMDRERLDALYKHLETCEKSERHRVKSAIDEQTRAVVLKLFVHLRQQSAA